MTQEPIIKEFVLNSKCKWGEFKVWTIVEDQLILTMEQTAEDFLREELWGNSVDFQLAKKIIEASNGELDWNDFLQIVDIDNGKIKWMWYLIVDWVDFRWSNIQWEIANKIAKWELNLWGNIKLGGDNESIMDLLENEEIKWDLDLSDTRITFLWKLKKLMWHLNLKWVKWLKSIWWLSYVHGDIEAQWANIDLQIDIVRKIRDNKLQTDAMNYLWWDTSNLTKLFQEKILKVGLDLKWSNITTLWELEEVSFLILQWLYTLESIWNLSKVEGFTDFIWVWVKAQKEAIDKFHKWELEIWGIPLFGWDVEWIEELLEIKDIPWILSFTGAPEDIQRMFIEAIESGKLKIKEYADFDEKIIKWYDQTPYN